MRLSVVILAGILLSGCAARARPKPAAASAPRPVAAAPEPEPELSIPQTDVRLPPPQPISPEALASIPPQPAAFEPPGAPPAAGPPGGPPQRRSVAPPAAAVKPDPPEGVQSATEPPRPRIQAILPPDERRRLTEEIEAHRREIQDRLAHPAARKAGEEQQDALARIRSFLSLSEQSARRGDLRQAHSLSERALVLARELSGGR